RAGGSGRSAALLEGGIELRDAGIKLPILVTGGYYGRAWGELLRHDLTPVLHDPGQVELLGDEVRLSGAEPMRAHVKIDTGMSRLGMSHAELPRLAAALARHPEVKLE